MARSPRQSEYERTARDRAALQAQATLLGWTKLDVLSAYLDGDGELVVIDKERARYGTLASSIQVPSVVAHTGPPIEPKQIPADEFAARWAKSREAIGTKIAQLDLTTASRADVLAIFTDMAAIGLRAVELLEHDGPDWRSQIGA